MTVSTGTPQTRSAGWAQQHPLLTFFVLSYALSWLLWTPLVIFRDSLPGALELMLLVLGSAVPSTVAIVLVARLYARQGVRTFLRRLLKYRVGLGWYVAVLAIPFVCLLAVGLSMAAGDDAPAMDITVIGTLVAFLFSIFPGSALGEELGWRGFALPSLQARRSALSAALIVGVVWGCWHLPLSLAGSEARPLSLFVPFVVSVVAASVLCTWLYNGTGGSLLIVVLFHATLNLPVTIVVTPFVEDETTRPFLIFVGLLVLAAAAVVVATGPADLSRTRSKQVALP